LALFGVHPKRDAEPNQDDKSADEGQNNALPLALLVARTLNARLAERTSLRASTLFNYAIGLAAAIPTALLLGRAEPAFAAFALSPKVWIYLGGVIGVVVVLLLNYTVTRVSAFSLSLFLFIGQVFAGILIDALFLGAFSPRLLIGGLLVAAGLVANVFIERSDVSAQGKSRE
jgi:transporter family-2 protein